VTRYPIWLTIALLFAIASLPSIAQAQSFGVSPAEVTIDGLLPGQEAEFELSIHNHYDAAHSFVLSTSHPWDRRPGRADFPDDSWIGFSPRQIEVAANSQAKVRVTVAIPSKQEWAGRDWEVWLGVTPEEKEFLVVNCYVRLLVSTSTQAQAGPNTGLIVGIAIGVLLLSYAVYYSRRKAKSKHQP
jgi:hypothetical protein